jgi:hypothetical protein
MAPKNVYRSLRYLKRAKHPQRRYTLFWALQVGLYCRRKMARLLSRAELRLLQQSTSKPPFKRQSWLVQYLMLMPPRADPTAGSGKTSLLECLSLRNRLFTGALLLNDQVVGPDYFTKTGTPLQSPTSISNQGIGRLHI